jgi:hypothetical protein
MPWSRKATFATSSWGNTYGSYKKFNERKNGDFYTQVKRLGMIKHIVDDVEQSNLQRLGMIQ